MPRVAPVVTLRAVQGDRGRDAELAAIEHWLDGARGALVIEGEAGIGMTTPWRAGVESASSRGVCVLVAAASAETAAAATSLSLTSGSDLTVLSGEDLNASVGRAE